jgi:ATP-dependent exoDNAse (exonuclease V) beta subunit
MSDTLDADRRLREEAVEPAASFVVQAPAGSGKTSLLTQRFLRLLAVVERPEEIVAITFTRKAAAEMRHRIVAALTEAAAGPVAEAGEHERRTRNLACAALLNSRRQGWQLERHPSRLHIQTIDGFNHWLSRKLPLSARLGLSPQLLDDARPVYGEAAQRFVGRVEQQDRLGESIADLVRMLDHDPKWLQGLFADMLARREIWLPKLLELSAAGNVREQMERLLQAVVGAELGRIRQRLDGDLMAHLIALIAEANDLAPGGPLAALNGLRQLPGASVACRNQWECLAAILLTRKGEARKTVNKNQGFPPEMKSQKERMRALLELLADAPAAAEALAQVLHLPPSGYTDEQWSRIEALRETLLPAAVELQAAFAERGLLDHAAVAAAARQALGGAEAPSELAQALEYRIRHILVDEYQDTSPAQQALLARLVAGWQPGDGHSLFCVGDPMQSIYGFREADVTLFLDAQARGIGDVRLQARSLTRNFRSCRSLVDWVNDAFGRLLPPEADFGRGAVPYTASDCTREDEPGAGATVHAFTGRDERREARAVAKIVAAALQECRELEHAEADRGESPQPRQVAVLVRARSALPPILAELRQQGIEYRGVELEPLGSRAAVRDLLALARALLHAGDRTAWLAVLRAPWCGLSLADLHALAATDRKATILHRLGDAGVLGRLSADGRARAMRVLATMRASLDDQGRSSLGSWVRSCWLALNGPATLTDESDLQNVEACFEALDLLAHETHSMPTAAAIESAVDGLMASPVGSAAARVQLMTIHKAKGLEFDTVVLPGLERSVTPDERQLLYWTPVAVEDGPRGIVLASHGGAQHAGGRDALESWMKRLDRDRSRLELGRLAYVAVTRARRSLHLLGSALTSWKDGAATLSRPRESALLGFLWPVVQAEFVREFRRAEAAGELVPADPASRPRRTAPPLRRLPAGYRPPPAPTGVGRPATGHARRVEVALRPHFDWAGQVAVAVGTVVHAELERIARAGLPAAGLVARPDAWGAELKRMGLSASRASEALERIGTAIARVAASQTAARLLDPEAAHAASELGLTAWLDGEFVSIKVDRTFVDEAGRRWIVDWKTGTHEGGSPEQFRAQETQRYAPQLERYARIMQLYDGRPQRLGLYFPMMDAWQDWEPDGPAAGT